MTYRITLVFVLSTLGLAACGSAPVVVETGPIVPEIVGIPPEAVEQFQLGLDQLNAEPPDYLTARGYFERVVELHPPFWEAWMNLGVLYTDLALYENSVSAFEQVLVEEPESREASIGIAKAYAMWGRTELALESYRTIIRDEQDNVEARNNIAAIYIDAGDYTQARTFINDILILEQNNVGALNLLGRIYYAEGDSQMAEYLWEKAIGFSESGSAAVSDARNNIGLMHATDGNIGRAVREFRRVIDHDPANVAAHLNLGAIYLEHLDYEGSADEFAQVLTLRPRDEMALMGFAASLYGLGDAQGAFDAYRTAVENYPRNQRGFQRVGDIAFRDLQLDQAAGDAYAENLRLRGLTIQTCDRSSDDVCAAANAIIEMNRQAPRDGEE